MEENECGKSGHLATSTLWSSKWCFWGAIFQGFIFHTLSKALVAPRAAERIFIWGSKDKKGHCNVKKGTNGVHADNYY